MVGGLLNVLDGQCILLRKVRDQTCQVAPCTQRQRFELCKAGIRHGHEPCNLNLYTAMHVALLAHERSQGIEFVGVTTVQRRKGGDGRRCHAPIVSSSPYKETPFGFL